MQVILCSRAIGGRVFESAGARNLFRRMSAEIA
jgi:hypothetical protein